MVGTIVTGIVTLVITISKFDRGAWIVVILVPIMVLAFRGISHHYQYVRVATVSPTPLYAEQLKHIIIVPIAELNLPAVQSLAYASSITLDVQAVHISTDPEEEAELQAKWEAWLKSRNGRWDATPKLIIIESPYRSMLAPLVKYVDAVRDDHPDATISVILPEYVPAHWWERILHNQTALRLKLAFYSRPGVVVINVPYHLPRPSSSAKSSGPGDQE
jgi:hypothetical protein